MPENGAYGKSVQRKNALCGGEHEYGKCEEGAEIKCCNCGGGHRAAYAACPVQQEAREIQTVKTMQKLLVKENQ